MAHANDLKLAELRKWETLRVENRERAFKQSTLVAPPSELDSDTQDSESESLASGQAGDHSLDAKLRLPQQDLDEWDSGHEIPLAEWKVSPISAWKGKG